MKEATKVKVGQVMKIARRNGKVQPAPMNLSGQAGKRIVVSAAKRVITTHSEVIAALADR